MLPRFDTGLTLGIWQRKAHSDLDRRSSAESRPRRAGRSGRRGYCHGEALAATVRDSTLLAEEESLDIGLQFAESVRPPSRPDAARMPTLATRASLLL